MQQVITSAQAKQITRGREPLSIAQVQQAIALMHEVQTIDESKYFADKADALAAWAKIYHKPEYEGEARRLKLHAFRRMGVLAEELRPRPDNPRLNGPRSLLRERGLTGTEADSATRLAKMPADEFKKITALSKPPSPLTHSGITSAWGSISQFLGITAARMRDADPARIAKEVRMNRIAETRELIIELTVWLREFERNLPKQ